MSHNLRKPAFPICENIGAGQLRSNRAADQRLCFHYIDSKITLLSKSKSQVLWLYSSVCVGPGQIP